MSMTTNRIASNVTVHGVAYAVEQEIKRAKRRGMGHQTAVTYAVEMVKTAIGHAGLRG